MDPAPNSTNITSSDTMDVGKSKVTLNYSMLAQLYDTTSAAEATHASLTNKAGEDALEKTATRSTSSPRASPPLAQTGKENHDSIIVSQQDAVRALRRYTTLTNTEIFRRVGVSASAGYRYLRGEDIKDKETRGRKRKLDESVINRIIHEIESQPVGEKTRPWEELCKSAGVEGVAPVTLKRAVESAGYYKCSHCQRGTFTGSRVKAPTRIVAYEYGLTFFQSLKRTAWAKTQKTAKIQRKTKTANECRTEGPLLDEVT